VKQTLVIVITAIAVVAAGRAPTFAECGPWSWANPLPQGNTLKAVAAGRGAAVAVGAAGTVLASRDDGGSWTLVDTGLDEEIRDVVWTGHDFVAVSIWHLLSSEDGSRWDVYDPTPLFTTLGVAWKAAGIELTAATTADDLVFVTGSSGTALRRGADGGWALLDVFGIAGGPTLDEAIWTGSLWVKLSGGRILTSPDGWTWTTRFNSFHRLADLAWSGGGFIVVGTRSGQDVIPISLTSADARTWAFHEVPNLGSGVTLEGVTWDGGRWVAVGNSGSTATSRDGASWTPGAAGVADTLTRIAWTGSALIAIGEHGALLGSSDAVTWSSRRSGPTDWVFGATASPSGFVAVGRSGAVLTSPDGRSWHRHDTGIAESLLGVAWCGDRLLAVGHEGTAAESGDGASWSPVTVPTQASLLAIAGSGPTAVAVGTGGTTLVRAPDGSWTVAASGTGETLYGVAWGDGRFAAVGGGGTILTSDDGLAWTPRTSGTTDSLYAVTWGTPGWVAAGSSGTILWSPNGATWTRVSDRAKEAFAAALWDGARYTVASDTGRILVGADGRTWSAERSPSAAWLRALTSFAGLRVAVGDAGAVLTSSCAPDPRVRRRLIRVP
jgi:hypothetical protein